MISLTKYREDIFKLTDEVIKSGKPLKINRKGVTVTISAPTKKSKLDNLKDRNCYIGDPSEIVEIDWSKEWNNDIP